MKITDIKHQNKLNEVNESPYLFHATFKPYLHGIKKFGLSGGWTKNYEDSKEDTVYLSLDPHNAISYAETSDLVPEEYLDQIIVLKIDRNKLDQSKLKLDQNVQGNQGDTLEYTGTIPASAIRSYKAINESFGGKLSSSIWFNTRTKELKELPNNAEHFYDVIENPEKYGLNRQQVSLLIGNRPIASAGDSPIAYKNILSTMFKNGWVRCNYDSTSRHGSLNLESNNLKDIRIALAFLKKKYVYLEVIIDISDGGDSWKYYTLDSEEKIEKFLRSGMINESRVPVFREGFWFNVKTKEFIEVSSELEHATSIRKTPEKYGITREKVKFFKDDYGDHDDALIKYMFNNDWVRARLQYDNGKSNLFVDSFSLKNNRTTIAFASKKYFFDCVIMDTSHPYQHIILDGEKEIKNFIRTGNINEAVMSMNFSEGWWFNTETKKTVVVPQSTEHIVDVMEEPEKYGITKEQINRYGEDIDLLVFHKHWVRCRLSNLSPGRVYNGPVLQVEGKGIKDIRMAVADATKNHHIEHVKTDNYVSDTREQTHNQIDGEQNIKNFIRTGVIKNLKEGKRDWGYKLEKFWFNTKTKKVIYFNGISHHTLEVVKNPSVYGFSGRDAELLSKLSETHFNLAVVNFMFKHNWVRGTIANKKSLDLQGTNLDNLRITTAYFTKRFPIEGLVLEIVDENHDEINHYELSGEQIKVFAKNGKITKNIDEARCENVNGRIWIDTKNKKIIDLGTKPITHHTLDVRANPRKYGVKPEEIGDYKGTKDGLYDEDVVEMMYKKGWVRGNFCTVNNTDLTLAGHSLKNLRIAAALIYKKIPLRLLIIEDMEGEGGWHVFRTEEKIKNFIKNGVIKESLNENGRIVQGANTPKGITVDHIRLMGERLGFSLSRDGRPPIMPTNGKINYTPPEDPDLSELDKKSMFGHVFDNTPLTDYHGKDMAASNKKSIIEAIHTDLYHGSPAADNILKIGFSYDYIGKGNDQYGYGFYFTNKDSVAKGYGNIVKASVTLKNPIIIDASKDSSGIRSQFPKLTKKQVYMILYRAPDIRNPDGPLSNWGDIRTEGFDVVMDRTLEPYTEDAFFSIMNDFYKDDPKGFVKAYNYATKKDGVIVNFADGGQFVIAWFPEQIKIKKE